MFYVDVPAYVLIGEPGAGKTTAFASEAAREGAECVSVRDFLTFDDKPEWHETTLFLDGLDESRAGTGDRRTPLDQVRKKLDGLARPRFRLSCRWADWLAATDKEALKAVSPDGAVAVVRLDPLSERDVRDILANNHGVADVDGFLAAARERGVERLLRNPQNLDLLAKSVAQGKWPVSRRETFENACRMLAREPNGEHVAANAAAADIESLIAAAGRLCAVQLLSGGAGYTLPDRAAPTTDYPSVADVDGDPQGPAWQVLGTRLFEGASQGRLAPAHRQLAEFLAARHVSDLLVEGLPLARILALVTGIDGELLPKFGNFASWLAVHSKPSRKTLSRFDASGLVYAGDRDTYAPDEKQEIVHNLRREAGWNPWCSRGTRKVSGIGAIVSSDLEATFVKILSDPQRDLEHQSYVMLLMQMLADGEPLPALGDVLEETVRDPSWSQGVRCAALDVLAAYTGQGMGFERLAGMVAEICDGKLDDPQDELLGILLKALYPNVLSAGEVFEYLRAPKLVEMSGEYSSFWTDHVPRVSTPEQMGELLDGIATEFEVCKPFMTGEVGRCTRMDRLPVELVEQTFSEQIFGESDIAIAPARLYGWLRVVADPALGLSENDRALMRARLRSNGEALKALVRHGVETCLKTGKDCTGVIDSRLFGARPIDYGPWCVAMALEAEDERAASFYLGELVKEIAEDTGGLTVARIRAQLAQDEVLSRRFEDLVRHRVGSGERGSGGAPEGSPAKSREGNARKESPAALAAALRDMPQGLHRAAEAFLGHLENVEGKSPCERLAGLVGGSRELADGFLVALEEAVGRGDLPDCDEVVRLAYAGRIDPRVLPFAAGLHILEQSGRLSIGDLAEGTIRLAVTILYVLPQRLVDPASADGHGTYRPAWFRALLRDNAVLVADVLRRTAVRKLELGVWPAGELRELAKADDHREVAALAALPVLEQFPKAETDASLMSLCWTLQAALERCDWLKVARVIGERLERGDQSAGERGCWLAAGYFTAPERYGEQLRALANDKEGLKSLVRFAASASVPRLDLSPRLAASDIETLVVAFGAAYRQDVLTERAYWFVTDLIGRFGDDGGKGLGQALAALEEVPEAALWLPAIREVRERQAHKRREQEFRHSDVRRVVETLANGSPANPGDLAAFVLDELESLARRTRDGSTSDWRQHWNVDGYKHATSPRPEDACRDAVLSDLKLRMEPLEIDAQPEGVYADDKRSDIRVSFGGFNVPVEIKRSCHDDLWTAVREQLIAKYTREPGAAGYGIYLVLWFGDCARCPPTKCGGWAPKTAEDVKRRLEGLLSDEERRLVSICVVDVSVPSTRVKRVVGSGGDGK